MEKCKKRNTEHCAKSKQCDQIRASIKKKYNTLRKMKLIRPTWSIEKMQNIEVLTLKVLIQRFLIKMFLF